VYFSKKQKELRHFNALLRRASYNAIPFFVYILSITEMQLQEQKQHSQSSKVQEKTPYLLQAYYSFS